MDIILEKVEDLLWQDGTEFELISVGDDDISLRILGLRVFIYLRPVWKNDEGDLIFDSDDTYMYVDDELFGQLNPVSAEDLVEQLNKFISVYR